MTKRKPTPKEFAAVLDFLKRGCPNGCKCALCLQYDLGYEAGFKDGAEDTMKAIQRLIGEVGNGKA